MNLKEVEYALEDLEHLLKWVNKDCSIAGFLGLIASANTIRIALEKQIPQKPKEVNEDYSYFVCPNCGFTIGYMDERETHKYCLNCGQKLDWH